MVAVDTEKLTLTQTIVVSSVDIKGFWGSYKSVLQCFIEVNKHPDYHEDYNKALAYELGDSDVIEILEGVKELYDRELGDVTYAFVTISDIKILHDAVAEWCDRKFDLGGTAL